MVFDLNIITRRGLRRAKGTLILTFSLREKERAFTTAATLEKVPAFDLSEGR